MKPLAVRIWAMQGLSASSSASVAARPGAPLLRSFFTSARCSAPSRLPTRPLEQGALLFFRYHRSALARRFRSLRLKSDNATQSQHVNPTPHLGSPEPALSLSQRLKKLSREYGWSALGVYFGLSLLDFPFCFLAVRLLGTDRIAHYEDIVKNAFWSVVRLAFPSVGIPSTEASVADEVAEATTREGYLGAGKVTARQHGGTDASIWTQLGLAYIVHKSLIFIRVPLTAAVLPKVVKTLRSWGYDIGKKKPKSN